MIVTLKRPPRWQSRLHSAVPADLGWSRGATAPAARAGWASPVGSTSAACSTPAVCSGRERDSTVCSQQPDYFRAGDTLGLGCSCEHVLRCSWRFISAIDRLFSERETQAASAALLTMRKLCPVQAKGGKEAAVQNVAAGRMHRYCLFTCASASVPGISWNHGFEEASGTL